MTKKMSALLVAVICFGLVAASPVLAKHHKKTVKSAKPAIVAPKVVAPVKK